jgi:cytidine deaminase
VKNIDIEIAAKARLNAWVPYSRFQVGVALRTKSGKVYTGCNIENHGIQSICGERTAFVKALSDGEREFASITVVGSSVGDDINTECLPCGYCRQFMSEFVDSDFKIYTIDNGNIKEYKIADILPYSFKLKTPSCE